MCPPVSPECLYNRRSITHFHFWQFSCNMIEELKRYVLWLRARKKNRFLVLCSMSFNACIQSLRCVQISWHDAFHVALLSPISQTGCLRIKAFSDWPRFSSAHGPSGHSAESFADPGWQAVVPSPYLGQSAPQLSSMAG